MRRSHVFSNLLNNAAKYTEPGGRIAIRASADAREASVSIRDNGIGIAVQTRQGRWRRQVSRRHRRHPHDAVQASSAGGRVPV